MNDLILTVDVEKDWGGRTESAFAVGKMLPLVLEILARHGASATFFVSTEILPQAADLLREACAAGHEMASHGHRHVPAYDTLDRAALRLELAESKDRLEQELGVEVRGFRSPQFRKHPDTEAVLAELGYAYDSSSVETSLPGRYDKMQCCTGEVPQYPVSTIRGRFPAGIKWVNLLGFHLSHSGPLPVVYSHLFDLFSLTATMRSFRLSYGLTTGAFYLCRMGSVLGTFERAARQARSFRAAMAQGILPSCAPGGRGR